jgi:hypothetical protein
VKGRFQKQIGEMTLICLYPKKVSGKLLETTIGCLNHAACLYHYMKHFNGGLYQGHFRVQSRNNWTSLTFHEKQDLRLHKCFLDKVNMGISMNNLTFKKPSIIYIILMHQNLGWDGIILPQKVHKRFHLRTSINSLEFLACTIPIG